MAVRDNTYGIADLQDKMLDILKYLDSICEKHHLIYWAAFGTCLGAIRHKGFIPWDDDLDVYMPRHDYEKLWTIWNDINEDPKYKLCRTGRDKNYHHRVMQVVDTSTTFINRRCANDDIEHGVYIDIMAMDGAAPNKAGQLIQAYHAIIYSVYNIQVEPEFHGNKMMEVGTRFLLSAVKNPEWRYKLWKNAEKKLTKYDSRTAVQCLDFNNYFKLLFKPMQSEWFKTVRVPFEDTTIRVPVDHDKYLTLVYGDYMQLPSEDKRTTLHNTVKIDLNTPYTEYKGKYYCVEK